MSAFKLTRTTSRRPDITISKAGPDKSQITGFDPELSYCTGSVEGSCHRARRLLRAPPGASSRVADLGL